MKTVGAREARAQFAQLLSDVEAGETVTITRRGIPVARFVPIERGYDNAAAAIEEWRKYRREHNIRLGDGLTIRDLIEEGRE